MQGNIRAFSSVSQVEFDLIKNLCLTTLPSKVILDESPPKRSMFSWIHFNASVWSCNPMFAINAVDVLNLYKFPEEYLISNYP